MASAAAGDTSEGSWAEVGWRLRQREVRESNVSLGQVVRHRRRRSLGGKRRRSATSSKGSIESRREQRNEDAAMQVMTRVSSGAEELRKRCAPHVQYATRLAFLRLIHHVSMTISLLLPSSFPRPSPSSLTFTVKRCFPGSSITLATRLIVFVACRMPGANYMGGKRCATP